MYEYRAHVTKVYDGDTVTVDIDLGFGIWLKKQSIRLVNIDTPEIRGEEREHGLIVRDIVAEKVLDKDITLRTHKDSKGKYGRWLGEVIMEDGTNLNEWLLYEGYADPYGS